MTSGGARNRSGPAPDPSSARSEKRGLRFDSLPPAGYRGRVPKFPLPGRLTADGDADDRADDREAELWRWAWRTPQAAAWATPEWRWLVHSIAMWVRTAVICESAEATAADKNSLHRFADQIGLTVAGMHQLGWSVRADRPAPEAKSAQAPSSSRSKLRVVNGGVA